MSKDRGGRKSSILKPPKVRHPLTELDLKPLDIEDDGVTTDTTRSRRVSFSAKKGVALFTSDHGNTIWHNIYEEANKPDLSDSGGASHFQMSMNSTKGFCELNAINPGHIGFDDNTAMKVEDDSYSESFNTNHDRTFATLPNDSDDEEDHCVDIHAMLTGFSKPVEKELSNIVFQTTQITFSDHTDALINYKIPIDSSSDPLYTENPMQDNKLNFPNIPTHFINNALGGKLDVTNIAGFNNSVNQKDTTFNDSQMDMSITQGIHLPIQEIKNITLKNNDYDKENIKVHMECHQDTNIQEDVFINYSNEKPHVKINTSILDQFQRDFVLKEEHLHEDCSIKIKRSLPEGNNLDDSYILPDKKTKNSSDQQGSDQRRTIIFNQDFSNCDMSITQVNENLIQCKREIDSFYPEVNDMGTDNENVKLQKSKHFYPNNSNCDVSFKMLHKNSQDGQSTDKRRTIIFSQDFSNCDMSMTQVNENLLQCKQGFDTQKENISSVLDHNSPKYNILMTCTGPDKVSEDLNEKHFFHNNISNMPKDSESNIDNNQVLVKTEDFNTFGKNFTKTIDVRVSKPKYKTTKDFDDIKMESNISIIDDFVLQKQQFKNELNNISGTHNKLHCKLTGLGSKENDQSIKMPGNRETFTNDCGMKGEEMASDSQFLNMKVSVNKGKMINSNEIIIPMIDKKRTIILDHLSSEFDMSITGIIPTDRDNERQTKDSDKGKWESNAKHLQNKKDNIRKTVLDSGMPQCKTKTANVEQIQNSALNQIKSIDFNPMLPECNVLKTSPVSKKLQIEKKTLSSNSGIPGGRASMPSVIINNEENKRKTTVQPLMPECNMSMTSIKTNNIIDFDPNVPDISTINDKSNVNNSKRISKLVDSKMSESNMTNVISSNPENKRITRNFNPDVPECNMSRISIIPCKEQNKRKTLIFDPGMPECNMSMTSVIESSNENKRQTLIFDSEMPECNMSMTSVIPSDQENKRKTLIFDPGMPECNMSMTSVIENNNENKRQTLIFDSEMPECNMSMTSVISSDQENKRKTLIFNPEMPECNMSMTSVISSDQVNKRKTLIFDPGMPECNMSMTSVISSDQENKRKTLIFNPEMPECNMSMTSVISSDQENKRKTLIFDPGMPECNMSMTSVIPSDQENKRKTLIFNPEMPECNISMTSVISSDQENKRKTLIFDPGMPECNMSMTSVIPSDQENKRKTLIFNPEMPECNMSMTSVISSDQENKRKTLIFDPGMPECNMSMTSVIPSDQENKRKTLIFNPEMPECNMSMTSVISSDQENKGKTLIFDPGMPECNMSMTSVIPSNQENKRKTLIFDPGMPECNVSMTSVIPSDQENKRKTLIFNPEMPESNMSMTSVIPSDQENKRKTLIFDPGMPECNMSMTSVIESNNENKRQTLIFDSEMPECNMSMTSVISSDQENKRKTLIFDPGMSECNMSMTSVIPSDQENKRKTLIINPEMPECNMSMTSVIPSDQENKRKTLIFDPGMPESNMSMTSVIPSDQENKRKTLIFDPGMPECNMSMTSVIESNNENKRQTLIFDSEMPECNMSMTSVISSDQENKRKTLIFDPGMSECNMSMTSVIPSDQENKRKTLIINPEMPECNMSMTSVIPSDQENKRKTLIFDPGMPECNMSMTSVIESNNENKRQTLIFDSEMPECNMSMTSGISSDQENKRKTLIFDPGMPECNMSMTSVISSDQENKRKTLIFDPGMPECNMSMTSVIPSDQENKRKTLIFNSEMPECNMSMRSVIPSNQENKRKTLIFDPGMPECNMSMTSVIESNNENKRQTLIFDSEMPECNMSMTSVIPSDQENKRKTLIFNPEMPECNMSMTSVIPSDQENKRKTLIFNPGMPECNMSMTSGIPSDQENKIKTLIFNSQMPECNMSMTSVIPNNNEIKRRTLFFDPGMPECNMSMMSVVSCDQEHKKKTLIFDTGLPESNMPLRSVILDNQENKIMTIFSDPGMPKCHRSITDIFSNFNENKCVIDNEISKCSMSMAGAVSCNNDKTIFCDSMTPESNTTGVVPDDIENYKGMPVSVMLSTSVIPSHRENKRNAIHVDLNMSECIKSVTNVISGCSENDSKPIEPKLSKHNIPKTIVTNINENKRNTIVFDPITHHSSLTSICYASQKNEISHNFENVKQLTVLDSEVIDKKDNKIKTIVSDNNMPEYNMTTISKIQNEDCSQIKKSMCVIKNHNSIVEKNEDMLMRNYICQDNVVHTEIHNTSMLEKEASSHEIYQVMKNPSSLEVIEKDVTNRDVSMLCKSRNKNNSDDNVTLEYPLGFSTNLKPGSVNRIQTKSKISMNLYNENINSSHADSQNISVQGKPATPALPENKLMTIDGSKNDDNKNKSTAYVKSVDCSMSMTNVLPRSAYWNSKNNITSTSFAAYNPINETRSMLVEHLDNNEKIMLNSSESYGTYREVSGFKDVSFTDSPDSKSMDDLSLPSIDDYKVVSCGSGLEVDKYNREVNIIINAPFDDSHMSVDDVHITLPSVEKSIKVNKYSLFEARNLGGAEEKTTHLSSDMKPCDKNSVEEDASISTKLVHSESDYYELVNLSTSKKNHTLHSDGLIQTLNQDLHSEAEILNKSNPISKSSNASREQSDSSTQKVDDSDSSKMKMVHVPVDLLETVGKRKSDHEYNENFNSTISKKQKVLPPVCTWLKDLDGDKENKSNVTNEVVKCSGIHEIDTRTYTITNIDHKKDRSLPTNDVKDETNCVLHNRKENNEEVDKNVQNSSDQLIANISDISLVNSSFDKSDLYLREHAAPVFAVDHNIEEKRKLCELIESVDEIIEKQCGTSNFGSGATSNPRPRNSEKNENYRLTNVSLCESIDTSAELTESPVRLPERRLTAQPEIIVTPVKYIVEELIRNFDFKTKLCALEYIECNECVFLLMDGAIKMTVLLEPSPSGASNLKHPIADIKLALTNESEKFSKPHQMFHWLAIKMVLHELEVRMLRVMCLVSADLPKLLTHCSQVISRAWSWSRQYYALYIKYNLQFENDRWTFEICSGHFLCIWEVEIQVRGGLLPYTVPDNVTVSTVSGDSPIKNCEFKSAMQKVKPSWDYVLKLVEEIHSLVNSHYKSSSR